MSHRRLAASTFSFIAVTAVFHVLLGLFSASYATTIVNTVSPECRPQLRDRTRFYTDDWERVRDYEECVERAFIRIRDEARDRLRASFADLQADVENTARFIGDRTTCPPASDIAAQRQEYAGRASQLRRIIMEVETIKSMVRTDGIVDVTQAFYDGILGGDVRVWVALLDAEFSAYSVHVRELDQIGWNLDALDESIETRIVMPSGCETASADDEVANTIIGTWASSCNNGREVTFEQSGGSIVGRYTALGDLERYGFTLNEEGYRGIVETGPGTYSGEVHWRNTAGDSMGWRENAITITGGEYTDTASDGCAQHMTRVRE